VSLKPLPDDLLRDLPFRLREWLRSVDRTIRERGDQIDSASGELLGAEDVTNDLPGALATADAAVQTGSYVQANVQSIATLANDLKAKLNALIAHLEGL